MDNVHSMSDSDNEETGVNVMEANAELDKELDGLAAEDKESEDYRRLQIENIMHCYPLLFC